MQLVPPQEYDMYLESLHCKFLCLFVLRFYGPVNPIGLCRAQSVCRTTLELGRLTPVVN